KRRVELPRLVARGSEPRVSSGSTTWPDSSPYGNRTHLAGLRGRCPLAARRTGRQCVGQELNLHSVNAGGLQPLRLANAQPTQVPRGYPKRGQTPYVFRVVGKMDRAGARGLTPFRIASQ